MLTTSDDLYSQSTANRNSFNRNNTIVTDDTTEKKQFWRPKINLKVDVQKLPRKVLENAVLLNDGLKKIYITLYSCGEHKTPKEIAKKLGYARARAYVHMRLFQLEHMDLVKRIDEQRCVRFQAF